MNKTQENKLTQYYSLRKVIAPFQNIWSQDLPFAGIYGKFAAQIPLLEKNRNAQETKTAGSAKDKTALRDSAEKRLNFLLNRLQSLADHQGNDVLAGKVAYTPTDVSRARDTALAGIANAVVETARGLLTDASLQAELLNFRLTAALFDEVQTLTDAYNDSIPNPTADAARKKEATDNLAILFPQTDQLIASMDRDVEVFKDSNPDFYAQYQTARKQPQAGKRKLSLRGSFTEAGTNQLVSGVKLTLMPDASASRLSNAGSTPAAITKKSTAQGNFQVQSLAAGLYQLKASKPGYVDQTLSFTIADGETTTITIQLAKG